MLSLFPQVLFLSPMGTALLRVTAGITLLCLAYYHGSRTKNLSQEKFIVIGSGAWIPILTAATEGAVGAALCVGYLTQLAAILAALIALKNIAWQKRYPQFFPLSRAASALLLVICLSLIVSGAGAFAFDLPL